MDYGKAIETFLEINRCPNARKSKSRKTNTYIHKEEI